MKSISVVPKSAILILFAFSAMPLLAQHGGGGHMGGGGGGFHGGGGGSHGGGGGSFHGGAPAGGGLHSGGGFHGGSVAPPAAGYGAPRASAPPSFRSGGGYASRPGYGGFSRPGGNGYAGGQRNPAQGAPAGTNGQWHSFGPASGGREPSVGSAAGAQSPNSGSHVITGNRSTAPGTVRSFSGQRGEVWESSASRNVVPRSQSLSTMHNSLGTSLFARQGARGSAGFSSSAHFTGGSPLLANRGVAGGVSSSSSFQQARNFGFNRFGYPSGGFRGGWHEGGWGHGCWNCGFGFGNRWGWGLGWGGWGWGGGWGLGWGWGSPWAGYWGFSPWYDPWWNWGWGGAGYYGYPTNNYYIYNYDGSGAYQPQDNSAPPAQENDNQSEDNYQGPTNGNWVTPNGPSPSAEAGAPSLSVPVLIYMKDGSVLTVRDYWMIDGELHYIQMNGVQKSVDLEQVDLGRSNAENARSGVKFIFKSEPNAPTLDETPAPPAAQPDSSTPVPGAQPEART